MPESSHKVLPFSEKVKFFDLRKEKKSRNLTLLICGKNASYIRETEEGKRNCAGSAVVPQTANSRTAVLNKRIVMEKTLHLGLEDMTSSWPEDPDLSWEGQWSPSASS